MPKITIIGAGSFGTSLAVTAARAGTDVALITQSLKQAEEINHSHTNKDYFDQLKLPETISAQANYENIRDCDAVVVAVPAAALFDVFTSLKSSINKDTPIILTSKGMVSHEGKPSLPLKLLQSVINNPFAVLAGPNFAIEIVENMPSATSIASFDLKVAQDVAKLFHHKTFRTYPSNDPMGCQVAGIVKNVLAIGCGLIAGMGFGVNTQAALITRGLAEMTRLGTKLGAQVTTFMGLSGIGDLMLTCTSVKSRNYQLGFNLGTGQSIETLAHSGAPLAEGYLSAPALIDLSNIYQVDMPICKAVQRVLSGEKAQTVIEDILSRPSSTHEFLEFSDVLAA